ncbi:DMT family transporter [Thauera sp. CAU 1555]|uniref:DMT family transporter n=1 Tax=Thauera sedimentorum TaxID=2767595 RepID=A0ABR9BA80_9RHOO|nr:DMT family transporter [Thauera sedimentorum]MBC9072024.1 DMT family transporter [Thauera sedimentorum]MBD8502943.1 DMT family transporter [Thauera sedimentorum]
MKPRDLFELFLLAALWGGSFLFTRIAVPEFGPFALIELRVGLAALVLLPVLAVSGGLAQLWRRGPVLLVLGLTSSALPFVLYAYATLTVTAGFAAVVNATTPLFTALVAWLWLRDRLSAGATLGLCAGVAGVVILVWDKLAFGGEGAGLAVAACLGATLSYGISASITKRYLTGAAPMVTATGSQFYAALLLAPLALAYWPEQPPSSGSWMAGILLAVLCTGLAFVLFFRLMARVGPQRAVTVTLLIPVFGMLWGALFIDEQVTLLMLVGSGIILLGTGLATGVVRLPR